MVSACTALPARFYFWSLYFWHPIGPVGWAVVVVVVVDAVLDEAGLAPAQLRGRRRDAGGVGTVGAASARLRPPPVRIRFRTPRTGRR